MRLFYFLYDLHKLFEWGGGGAGRYCCQYLVMNHQMWCFCIDLSLYLWEMVLYFFYLVWVAGHLFMSSS